MTLPEALAGILATVSTVWLILSLDTSDPDTLPPVESWNPEDTEAILNVYSRSN